MTKSATSSNADPQKNAKVEKFLFRILDPDFPPSRNPDPGSRMPDPQSNKNKKEEEKIFLPQLFF